MEVEIATRKLGSLIWIAISEHLSNPINRTYLIIPYHPHLQKMQFCVYFAIMASYIEILSEIGLFVVVKYFNISTNLQRRTN